ncbi:MAG: hypothetical protein WBD26_17615, partial [Candidatus Acidiferrales bacterium]
MVLDTQYAVHYTPIDRDHEIARSLSTAVAEVDHAGSPNERDEPAGQPGDNDHGFLWRLDSYWRFYQSDCGDGYDFGVHCEFSSARFDCLS